MVTGVVLTFDQSAQVAVVCLLWAYPSQLFDVSPQPVCSRTADLSSKIAGTMPAKLAAGLQDCPAVWSKALRLTVAMQLFTLKQGFEAAIRAQSEMRAYALSDLHGQVGDPLRADHQDHWQRPNVTLAKVL